MLTAGGAMLTIGLALFVAGWASVWKGSPPSEAYKSQAAFGRYMWRVGAVLAVVGLVTLGIGAIVQALLP